MCENVTDDRHPQSTVQTVHSGKNCKHSLWISNNFWRCVAVTGPCESNCMIVLQNYVVPFWLFAVWLSIYFAMEYSKMPFKMNSLYLFIFCCSGSGFQPTCFGPRRNSFFLPVQTRKHLCFWPTHPVLRIGGWEVVEQAFTDSVVSVSQKRLRTGLPLPISLRVLKPWLSLPLRLTTGWTGASTAMAGQTPRTASSSDISTFLHAIQIFAIQFSNDISCSSRRICTAGTDLVENRRPTMLSTWGGVRILWGYRSFPQSVIGLQERLEGGVSLPFCFLQSLTLSNPFLVLSMVPECWK